jgi:transcription factor E
MQKKFLEEVMLLVAGKPADQLVDLLSGKKNVNEFLIAKKLDITINQTRNILYKLSDYSLVSSIRKKDKKKGWYTYFWTIENLKALEFLKSEVKGKIDQLDSQVKSRETKVFYVCKICNIELSEENALLRDFTCNECGEVYSLKDNSKLVKELKKNRDKLGKELQEIDSEILQEKEKEKKRIEKEIKKSAKEKAAKRIKPAKKTVEKSVKKTISKRATKKKTPKKKLEKKKVEKKTNKSSVKKKSKGKKK